MGVSSLQLTAVRGRKEKKIRKKKERAEETGDLLCFYYCWRKRDKVFPS